MNLLGILENGLFALSQVLRLPVILLLWLCVAAARQSFSHVAANESALV